MTYSEITFNDKNPVKRWLQRQRLVSALEAVKQLDHSPSTICDFGAGNGELCKLLSKHYPNAHIICYEPTAGLLNEARENLKTISNISFIQDTGSLKNESVDLVFSLEVFEHLPLNETKSALQDIYAVLKSKGQAIIGVPVEIGIPALYKGAFRMARRYGAFDANFRNTFISLMGKPPKNRPTSEITPGFNYHFEHVGFDHRRLFGTLKDYFNKLSITSSPFSLVGAWLMPEVYFTAEKS
jgi:SAM-dependent methyltransferase